MFNRILHSEATMKEGTVTTVTGSNVGNASSNHSVTVDNDGSVCDTSNHILWSQSANNGRNTGNNSKHVLGSAEHLNNNVEVMKDFMANE